jgi:hypothetical protein
MRVAVIPALSIISARLSSWAIESHSDAIDDAFLNMVSRCNSVRHLLLHIFRQRRLPFYPPLSKPTMGRQSVGDGTVRK